MNLDKRVAKVIESLSRASIDNSAVAWQNTLDELAELFSSGAAALTLYSPETDRFDIIATTYSEGAVDVYNDRFRQISPMHPSIIRMSTGEIYWRSRDNPDDRYLESEIYQQFFKSEGVYDLVYSVVLERDGRSAGVTFSRPSPGSAFSQTDINLMQVIFPHLSTAVRNCMILSSAQRDTQRMSETLSKIPRSIIFVDQRGEVTFVNDTAAKTLAMRDGLEVDRNGKLFASLSKDERELRAILTSVFEANGSGEIIHDGVLPISRPSHLRPLQVMITPFADSTESGFCVKRLALVVVYDPESNIDAVERILSRMYDLTPAEAKVAVLITKGRSLVEASDLLGVSHDTVRTHLKRIFNKTGTSRQSQLITLIFNSPAALKNI
jgi:DNA-binding CsgD family transcriptional regulator